MPKSPALARASGVEFYVAPDSIIPIDALTDGSSGFPLKDSFVVLTDNQGRILMGALHL